MAKNKFVKPVAIAADFSIIPADKVVALTTDQMQILDRTIAGDREARAELLAMVGSSDEATAAAGSYMWIRFEITMLAEEGLRLPSF